MQYRKKKGPLRGYGLKFKGRGPGSYMTDRLIVEVKVEMSIYAISFLNMNSKSVLIENWDSKKIK